MQQRLFSKLHFKKRLMNKDIRFNKLEEMSESFYSFNTINSTRPLKIRHTIPDCLGVAKLDTESSLKR